jgi:hypothetical protein
LNGLRRSEPVLGDPSPDGLGLSELRLSGSLVNPQNISELSVNGLEPTG